MEPAWYTDTFFNRTIIKFKIDSGADVTVMSESAYSTLKDKPKLRT
jgi:hypothetical protein